MPIKKQRADELLFHRGLISSRNAAAALIMAGRIFSGNRRIDKAGELISVEAPLEIRDAEGPFVSRGGIKLEGALGAFGLDANGIVAEDFGASTGGFTDCLLQRGARRVYAIDVGYGLLHEKLRSDPRVIIMERLNARYLSRSDLPERIDWVVVDASFIGLENLLPAAHSILKEGGEMIALVKPQFEVMRGEVPRGGVILDEEARLAAINKVALRAEELGFEVAAGVDSILPGARGNREHFLWLSPAPPRPSSRRGRDRDH